MALPGLDTGLALRSMRLFAEQVAPAISEPRELQTTARGERP